MTNDNQIFNDLPKELIIDKRKFKLFCGSVFDNETYDVGHLVTIFDINNDLFVVNAIGKQCEFLPPFYPNILLCSDTRGPSRASPPQTG